MHIKNISLLNIFGHIFLENMDSIAASDSYNYYSLTNQTKILFFNKNEIFVVFLIRKSNDLALNVIKESQ